MTTQKKNIKRRLKGLVTSAKMDKTIIVEVVRVRFHSKYKKQYKVSKKYKVHDGKGLAKAGDKVIVEECRPISKDKRWLLIQIIK
jgi:small subunit ribosomal protein S17